MRKAIRWAALALITLGVAGCATAPRRDLTLHDELGGQAGIAALVDAFLNRVADDYRIVDSFSGANISRLRRLLEEQFCEVSGGPCTYTGESMEESHRGMGLRETEFNALVEDLIYAMEDLGIRVPVQNRLLAKLVPMHGDIMGYSQVQERAAADHDLR
jgi:hemoglobin